MDWPALFGALVLSHLVGDFLLQTDWQARHKEGGLGRDPVARRALLGHGLTYGLAFVPALVWVGSERTILGAVALGALVVVPHVAVDDGRAVQAYIHRVKHVAPPTPLVVRIGVDQTVHLLALAAAALAGAA